MIVTVITIITSYYIVKICGISKNRVQNKMRSKTELKKCSNNSERVSTPTPIFEAPRKIELQLKTFKSTSNNINVTKSHSQCSNYQDTKF